MLHNLTGKLEMDNELDLELKYYIDTYFFLQLCKKLRQPTWKKQILEFSQQYGKIDSSQEVHGKVNSVQKLNSFTSPNNLFILNPELQALMYVNSMIRDLHYLNDLTLQQQLDIDWFYLSLLQRWLKKYTNSQLVKNIASKFQSHLDTIDKMIEILMNSNPSKSLLLKFTLPLANGEISNNTIDNNWVHLNNTIKNTLSYLAKTRPEIQVSFIKKLSLYQMKPMFCGCLHISSLTHSDKIFIVSSLLQADIQCKEMEYTSFEPLPSKFEMTMQVSQNKHSMFYQAFDHKKQWSQEKLRITSINAINKDKLRQSLFNVLNPFEELIFQVNLDGPLIDQRHKKRFFSSSLVKDR